MESFVTAVAQVGFPIAVAGYLLLRQEKTIKDQTDKFEAKMDAIERAISGDNGLNVRVKELKNEISALRRDIEK